MIVMIAEKLTIYELISSIQFSNNKRAANRR
jgi:hypothetical protein